MLNLFQRGEASIMKSRRFKGLKTLLALSVLLAMARPAHADVSDYFWDNAQIPENKYCVLSYYTTFSSDPNQKSARGSFAHFENFPARAIKNESGRNELTIILPYLNWNYYSPKYNDAHTGFIIIKTDKDEKQTAYYPAYIPPTLQDENVHGNKRFRINDSYNWYASQIPLAELKFNKDFYDTYPVPDPDYPGYDKHIHYLNKDEVPQFALGNKGEKERAYYNVIIKLIFNKNDVTYERPTSIIVTYEKTARPLFIGTLNQTKPGYTDDKYGGWNKWTPFDGTDYPYTYTFKPTETEYDFIIGLENVIHPDTNYDSEKPYHLFHNYDLRVNDPLTHNIYDLRGTTQKFHGYYMLGAYDMKRSIHISGLDPNKVYQLKVDKPFPESINYDDVMVGWVSLMEYTPDLKAYQLVKHEGEFDANRNQVYYTYDFNKIGSTYKVSMDAQDNVLSCEKISLDESTAYKPSEYKFTDKLFVRTEDPEWMSEERVDAKILGITGTLVYKGESIAFDAEKTNDPAHINKVYTVPADGAPFEAQDFTFKDYSYRYNNEYELIKWFDNNGIPNSVGRQITDAVTVGDIKKKTFLNGPVEGQGQLVVPTPASENVKYELAAENVAETAADVKGNTVYLRFYDDELRGDAEYAEMPLNLKNKMPVHSHDYNVTFPYDNPNVTEELKALVRNGADEEGSETTPYVAFQFLADGEPTGIYSAYEGTPGYYNADLGVIYDMNVNGESETAKSSMSIVQEPSIEEFPYIYDRWDDMIAEVELKLNAPDVTLSSSLNQRNVTTNLYRGIRRIEPGKDEYEEFLFVTGVQVVNTDDEITGGTLETGETDDNRTTLYLVDVLDRENPDITLGRILATSEELAEMRFDIAVSEEHFKYAEWPGWNDDSKALIDVSKLSRTITPAKLRNVYLFPVENEGFNNSADIFSEETETPGEVQNGMTVLSNAAQPVAAEPKTSFYAVTTPAAPLEVNPEEISRETPPVTTGINDVTVETTGMARAMQGAVEVLVEGTELYAADGALIGKGHGTFSVVPGLYIARKGNLVQKVLVK